MKYNLVNTNTQEIEKKNVELEKNTVQQLNNAYKMNYSPLRWCLVENNSNQK